MKFVRPIRRLLEGKIEQSQGFTATLRDALLHMCRAERPPRTVSRLAVDTRCDRRTLERHWHRLAGGDAVKLHVVVAYFHLLADLEHLFAENTAASRIPKKLRQRARATLGSMPLNLQEAQILALRHCPLP